MTEYVIQRDGARNLRFKGERIAYFSTKLHQGPASNRWLELALYRTASGKLVAQRIGRTIWQGERDRFEAQVCADHADVIAFFGFCPAAKELYEQAGIDAAEIVE